MITAAALVVGPVAARGQGAGDAPHPVDHPFWREASGPATAPTPVTAPDVARTPTAPAVGRAVARIRVYSPAGIEASEPLRAAVAAALSPAVLATGRAAYEPRPGLTVVSMEAQVSTGRGTSLTIGMRARLPGRGRALPLRYRGRGRRFAVAYRIAYP